MPAFLAPAVPFMIKLALATGAGAGATYAWKDLSDEELEDQWTDRTVWNSVTLGINKVFEGVDRNKGLCAATYNEYDTTYKALWAQWHAFYTAAGNRSWLGGDPSPAQIQRARGLLQQLAEIIPKINDSVRLNCPDKASQLVFADDKAGIDTGGTPQERQQKQTQAAIENAHNQKVIDNLREGRDPNAPRPPPVNWPVVAKNATIIGGVAVAVWAGTVGYRIYRGR